MGITLFIAIIVLLVLGFPVAFALAISAALAVLVGGRYPQLVVFKEMFTGIDSFPLMAVPFFILSAELMSGGALTHVLLRFAAQFVGHLRGGLGYANVLSLTLFSGISGSALADAAGPGSMMVKMMDKAGYASPYAAALTASTGTCTSASPAHQSLSFSPKRPNKPYQRRLSRARPIGSSSGPRLSREPDNWAKRLRMKRPLHSTGGIFKGQ